MVTDQRDNYVSFKSLAYTNVLIVFSIGLLRQKKRKIESEVAVGYNFKSDVYFYDVQGNKNGKMTTRSIFLKQSCSLGLKINKILLLKKMEI